MSTRVTLNDVAQRAGVHYTTVSLALRNNPRIPDATRKTICALAEEMGYRPDPVLHALISYRFQVHGRRPGATIAYITNGPSRYGWRRSSPDAEYFAGAESAARGFGFKLEHFWMAEPGLSHSRLSDIIHTRGITGLIVGPNRDEFQTPLSLEWDKFSAVKIDNMPCESNLHRVCSDRNGAVRLAVQKARASGYSRIGFVMHETWDENCEGAWTSGIAAEQWASPHGGEISIHRVTGTHQQSAMCEISCRAFQDWMGRFKPQIIIGEADMVKQYIAFWEKKEAAKLPFIDVLLRQAQPAIAGVIHHFNRIGEIAVEMLASQMRQSLFGPVKIPTTTLVECTWNPGESMQTPKNLPPLECAI